MVIKVRERSLFKISIILSVRFAGSAYEAFRSIGTKHHGSIHDLSSNVAPNRTSLSREE